MIFDDFLKNQFSTITSKAAVASFKFVGKKDKIGADKAAVDVMRKEINKLKIDGHIVIGEGELDEAPMLYIGEKVGTGDGMAIDIAVDPVEGTNFVANNLPGGLSLIAIAEKGKLLNAPETYMNKIAINNDIHAECVDLDYSIIKNINNIADFKKVKTSEITACLLDRPRHKNIINELKKLKVNLKLISDGDVSGALMVTDKKYNVDIFLGIGGGPEGVLAAVALDSYNCKFQGRFIFDNEKSRFRAKKMGIVDLEKKYELNELVKGESILFATGITNGELVSGVKLKKNEFITETLVTHKNFSNNIIINKIPNT